MYRKLKKMIEDVASDNIEQAKGDIRSLTCGEAMRHWYYKSLMTPVAMTLIKNAPQESKIPDEALRKMDARITKAERKRLIESLSKVDEACAADIPDTFTISIEWSHSKHYGMNPTATLRAGRFETTGSASGAGYDKESAAVAYAMNKNSAIRRLWYDHAERGGKFAYSMFWDADNPKSLPSMDGGCGMNAVMKVFEDLGYKCDSEHGRIFDFYRFTKMK